MGISGKIDIRGQVAVVTGAARGIGRAVALAFTREGARLGLGDVLPLDDTLQAVETMGGQAIGLRTDISTGSPNPGILPSRCSSWRPMPRITSQAQ